MNWYYSDAGQQVGPVSEEAFQEAIGAGKIIYNTPVWNESLTNWQEYGKIVSLHLEAIEQEICSRCRNIFPSDDLIQYEGALICANCKPYVFQVLKESGQVDSALDQSSPQYFSVSQKKLILMSLCTSGIYEIYWFYKHWDLIKHRTNRDIQPFWRALFSIFFIHSLFRGIKESAEANQIPCKWSPGVLGWSFILLSVTWKLPDPYWIITFLSLVPLLPVQKTINEINNKVAPFADKNEHFSGKNIAVMIFGFFWLSLVILGLFMPE